MMELLREHAAKSELENDFSGIYYISNNLQRSQQAESELAAEMREKEIKTVIPPDFMPYRLAFLKIADKLIHGRSNASELTEYNEDWIRFFIYKLAVEVVKPVKSEKEYLSTNRRHNIASDFDGFISAVINYMKWDEVQKLTTDKDEPESMFVEVYKKYMKEGLAYKGEKFFSAMIAYKQLYDYLEKTDKIDLGLTLIIEDLNDMEPIFRLMAGMLKDKGVKILEKNSLRGRRDAERGTEKHRRFVSFMTPLDEAEVVGFEVKKLLAAGVPEHEIAVVPCNSKSNDLIELVFHRFGIKSSRTNMVGSSPLFKLFEEAVYLIKHPEDNAENILSLIGSEYSSFSVSASTLSRIKAGIRKKGYKINRAAMDTISDAVDATVQKSGEYIEKCGKSADKDYTQKIQKDIKRLEDLKNFIGSKPGSIREILAQTIDGCTNLNRDVLYMLSKAAELMDKELPMIKDGPDRKFMLDAMFSAVAEQIYTENIDPEKEAKQYINELGAYDGGAFFIPVMDMLSADNINAEHIFLFGLDASVDRPETVRYPGVLAKHLKMPDREQRKAVKYRKLMNVINNASGVFVSYAFLNLDGRVEGMSNLARMIADKKTRESYKDLKGFQIIENRDNSLFKSYEYINRENLAPDISYTYTGETTGKKFGSKEKKDPVLSKAKVADILQDDKDAGGKKVRVTDFVKYIQCPRSFVFTMLARKTSLLQPDADSQARMDKGSFWHLVFQHAGTEYRADFNTDLKGIKKALDKGLEKALSEYDPEIFEHTDRDDFIKETKGLILPVFADMEMQRRVRFPGLSVIKSEEDVKITLVKDIILEGVVDRIDTYEGGTIFWDYKTGAKPPEKMQLLMAQGDHKGLFRKSYQGGYAIQLAAYLTMAEKMGMKGIDDGVKMAGIIGLKGYDNLEDPDKIAKAYPDARAKMEEAIKEFSEKFIKSDLAGIEKASGSDSGFCAPVDCKYCDYEKICSVMELKGGDEDDTQDN